MTIQIPTWQTERTSEIKGRTCISIHYSLIEEFHKKYPEGNFSMFVEQKLKEELEK